MNSLVIPPCPNWHSPNILACAPDGTLVYGANLGIVIVKPKPDDEPAEIKLISFAHFSRINTISLNSNWSEGHKFIVSAGDDKVIKVWDCDSLKVVKSHNAHTANNSKLIGAVFAGSDKIISVSEDGMVTVWRISTNEVNPIKNLFGPKAQVTCISSCPHAPWLCAFGFKNEMVMVADLRLSGQIKYKFRGWDKNTVALSWCPVPVNIFPVSKAKQIILRRVQKSKDETEVPLKPLVENAQNTETQLIIPQKEDTPKISDTNVDKTENVSDGNKENAQNVSAHRPRKNNPWANLRHADDDEIQEEETPEKVAVESDFLTECVSLRDQITRAAEGDEKADEEKTVPEDEVEALPRKILKPRKIIAKTSEDSCIDDVAESQCETNQQQNEPKQEESHGNVVVEKIEALQQNEENGEAKTEDKIERSKFDVDEDNKIVTLIDELLKETESDLKINEIVQSNLEKLTSEIIINADKKLNEDTIDVEESAEEFEADCSRKEFLLASVSTRGTIMIWRAGTDGKLQTKFFIGSRNKGPRSNRPREKSTISLCWISPTILLSSGDNGELLQWDLKNYSTGIWHSKIVHSDHQSNLFSIAAPMYKKPETEDWREPSNLRAWTIGQERMLLNTNVDVQRKTVACYPTFGSYVSSIVVSPIDPNKVALGTGEHQVKIWDLSRPQLQYITMTNFKIKPLAKVLNIAWHPEQEGMLAYGTDEGHIGFVDPTCASKPPTMLVHHFRSCVHRLEWGPNKNDLYACSEGVIIKYDTSKAIKSPTVIQMPDGKDIKHFAWKPDHSLLAVGTKDGEVMFFTQDLVYQTSLFYQQKTIVYLAWHPQGTAEDEETSPYEYWLASSTGDGCIVVFDMKNCTEDVELSKRIVAEHKEHSKFVHTLSWSPHEGGKLLSASEEGAVYVWDVKNNVLLSTFINNYNQPILGCTWSPLDKRFILLGGRENSLQVVNVDDYKPLTKQDVLQEWNKRKKRLVSSKPAKDMEKLQEVPVKKSANCKDVMLCSVSTEQRDRESLLKTCRLMIAPAGGDNKSSNPVVQLFGSQDEVCAMLNHEQELHVMKGKHNLNQHLSLWKGDISETIKDAITNANLSPWLISMAPMVSPALWQEACEVYAKQLSEDPNGSGVEAASYYLSCHQVEKAVEVLLLKKLFREALALVKCRLPHDKSLIDKVVLDWASCYIMYGSYEISAQCFISLGNYEEAAKALYKRSDLDILALAVELAEKSNNTEMINTVKFRYNSFKADGDATKQKADETNPPTLSDAALPNGDLKEAILKENGDAENAAVLKDNGEDLESSGNDSGVLEGNETLCASGMVTNGDAKPYQTNGTGTIPKIQVDLVKDEPAGETSD